MIISKCLIKRTTASASMLPVFEEGSKLSPSSLMHWLLLSGNPLGLNSNFSTDSIVKINYAKID